jgi:hypothetical protein
MVHFKVNYNYGSNCPVAWGANPYRFVTNLYRNGGPPIATQTFQGSGCFFNPLFMNISAVPGTYYATTTFEKRIGIFRSSWKRVEEVSTTFITASNEPATPDFDINGDGESPVNVNIRNTITLNAAASTCENYYFIGIAERGYPSWTRTFQYEIGRWFGGSAPNGINLQLFAVTYSHPPDFTGPMGNEGTPLSGGPLPSSGEERWYDVAVCTDEPSWQCKNLQLRVEN